MTLRPGRQCSPEYSPADPASGAVAGPLGGVVRLGVAAGAGHVITQPGVPDQQALIDEQAQRLSAGLPGVAVVLGQRGDRRGGAARGQLPLRDLLAQLRSEAYVSSWVRFVTYRHACTL